MGFTFLGSKIDVDKRVFTGIELYRMKKIMLLAVVLLAVGFLGVTNGSDLPTRRGIEQVHAASVSAQIVSPASGAIVSGMVDVVAAASSSAGISQLEFYVDGAKVATDSSAPYSFNWNTSNLIPGSSHNLAVRAIDFALDNAFSPTVTVQIQPDMTDPEVLISSPANGSLVRRNSVVQITANASDNYQMERVEFFVNGVLLCNDVTSAYVCSWAVPAKKNVSYQLEARAFDSFGNSASAFSTVTSR